MIAFGVLWTGMLVWLLANFTIGVTDSSEPIVINAKKASTVEIIGSLALILLIGGSGLAAIFWGLRAMKKRA